MQVSFLVLLLCAAVFAYSGYRLLARAAEPGRTRTQAFGALLIIAGCVALLGVAFYRPAASETAYVQNQPDVAALKSAVNDLAQRVDHMNTAANSQLRSLEQRVDAVGRVVQDASVDRKAHAAEIREIQKAVANCSTAAPQATATQMASDAAKGDTATGGPHVVVEQLTGTKKSQVVFAPPAAEAPPNSGQKSRTR